MRKTALIYICTGPDYWKFIQQSVAGAKTFFPADVLLFTDSTQQFDVAKQVQIPHVGWPDVTLKRYHTILTQKEWLSSYDYIFYLDIDTRIVQPIGDEIFADGITVALHSAFIGKPGTPETNSRSTAYLSMKDIRQYIVGGFNGGTKDSFLTMAETISRNVDIDTENRFIAVWHDESHLNRYVFDHPPAKILPPTYCAREFDFSRTGAFIITIPKGTPDRPQIPDLSDVTVGIKTFLRDESLFHNVRTLRAQYPAIRIIVADDGRCTEKKKLELLSLGVERYIELPWNIGLSEGRNILLDACQTQYILFGDDDFSYTEDSHVEQLRTLMDVSDIAAGRVFQGSWLSFEGDFCPDGKIVPISREMHYHSGVIYQKADLVLNFFVGHVASLKKVYWDTTIPLGYEHQDFFLRAKKAGLNTVFCPAAVANHKEASDASNTEYHEHRTANWGKYAAVFEEKWGFAPNKFTPEWQATRELGNQPPPARAIPVQPGRRIPSVSPKFTDLRTGRSFNIIRKPSRSGF